MVYRLKHMVSNPIVKAQLSGEGRVDLEDIASRSAALVTRDETRRGRTGEGVRFEAGDVLFGKLRPYLKKSLLCEAPGLCSPELLVLRPNDSLVNRRFLHYVVRSAPFTAWAEGTSKGSKMPRTDFEALGEFRLELPPPGEQRCIADFLDEVAQEADALLDRAARLESLVSERLRALREHVLATSLAGKRLKWYTISIAQGESPQAEDRTAGPEEWAVLKLSAVRGGSFRPHEHKALPVSPDRPGLRPEKGDLLITRANTPDLVGDCCVVEKAERRLLLPDLIYRVRLDTTQLLPRYAMHFLLSPTGRSLLEAAARGTSQSMVKLRGADILNVCLPVPSASEQAEIVHRLDIKQKATDAIVRKVAALEERVGERVDALITAAVTGQLDPSSHRISALA